MDAGPAGVGEFGKELGVGGDRGQAEPQLQRRRRLGSRQTGRAPDILETEMRRAERCRLVVPQVAAGAHLVEQESGTSGEGLAARLVFLFLPAGSDAELKAPVGQ